MWGKLRSEARSNLLFAPPARKRRPSPTPPPLNAPAKPANRAHKLAAAASGAVGGALGLAALPLELPISTTILLRSIAEIAREEGEDLNAPEAAFACVEVFALGGQRNGEAAFESGYFAVRTALAKSV